MNDFLVLSYIKLIFGVKVPFRQSKLVPIFLATIKAGSYCVVSIIPLFCFVVPNSKQ